MRQFVCGPCTETQDSVAGKRKIIMHDRKTVNDHLRRAAKGVQRMHHLNSSQRGKNMDKIIKFHERVIDQLNTIAEGLRA